MKALKQFFVLATVFISAELVIAYIIIRDYQTQKAQLETQGNYIGAAKNSQTDSIKRDINSPQLTAK